MEGVEEFPTESKPCEFVVSIAETSKGAPDGSSISPPSNKMVNNDRLGIKLPKQQNSSFVETEILIPRATKRISPIVTPNEAVRRRSSFLKSKSRLVEPPSPTDVTLLQNKTQDQAASKSPLRGTPRSHGVSMSPTVSVTTPKPSLVVMTSARGRDEDEDGGDVYKSIDFLVTQQCGKKVKVLTLLEWIVFVSLVSLLTGSLTIHKLQHTYVYTFALWRWCVLGLVIFCSRLITEWFITVLFCSVELKLYFRRNVVYFMYGLKTSVWVFVWFGFVFVSWVVLFRYGIGHRSKRDIKILHDATMALAGCLVCSGIWLLKALMIKAIALSFHVKKYFDRIQESLYHQYVLQVLSGPPLMDIEEIGANSKVVGTKLSLKQGNGIKEEVVDVEKLSKLNQDKVSARTMKGLINVIRGTKLSIVMNTLEDGEDTQQPNEDIKSKLDAKAASDKIFQNVAAPGHNYIEEEDLLRFMKMDEVDRVFSLFQGAIETGKITKSALEKWVVNAYLERKTLAYSLTDTGTAIKNLTKLGSAVVFVVIIVVWNLMMGFFTIKMLVFLTSQLLLLVFMFGNTAKTLFEGIIFVFVIHPFDVGNRCVIDGVQMVVEEMNILTTVFLRHDNEKISYPNSVLATKPISNFYRSPEMSDSVEFAIDFSTNVETIAMLKAKIKMYIDSKPESWRPSHSVQVKDIVDLNKITIGLYVTHTINFQDSGLKSQRRSDLVLELKKIFQELGISYHLLPQQVHVV